MAGLISLQPTSALMASLSDSFANLAASVHGHRSLSLPRRSFRTAERFSACTHTHKYHLAVCFFELLPIRPLVIIFGEINSGVAD